MPDIILPGSAGRIEARYSPRKDDTAPIALVMHPHPKVGAPLEIAQIFRRFAEPYRHKHTLADHPARVH